MSNSLPPKPPGAAGPTGAPQPPEGQGSSTRPYLIRALHDWCTDNGFTPYVAVFVDRTVQVPMEYVKNSEIVLNVGFEATSGLKLGNEFIEFKARFGGVARDIVVPVDHVVAIYARENGQGMAFPVPSEGAASGEAAPVLEQPAGPRGLRLASQEDSPTAAAPTETGPRLAPAEPAAGHGPDDDGPGGPAAPTPSGRPSLKRVK
jgi:stringent starvation protein B